MVTKVETNPASTEEVVNSTPETIVQEPTSDFLWIQQTLNGDTEAFGQLHQKYYQRFLGLAQRSLRNQADAEDVLEEAFTDAYRHLADFQGKSRFSTWLYSIVVNHIRNKIRRSRVIHWSSLDGTAGSSDEDRRPIDFAENAPSLDSALDSKLQLEAVYEAVKSFPPYYRIIFTRFYFDGVCLQDIADDLGRPLGTVKAYLHHARQMLYKHRRLS